MKDLIGGAMRHVARVIEPMVGKLTEQSQTLSEPQMLHRYEKLHRGNPVAMAQFVAQNAPEGAHPMAAMRQYESQMEELRKKIKGGQ